MNDTRSSAGTKAQEMLELAERLDKMKSPYGDYRGYSLHYKERDMIVAALRLAAQTAGRWSVGGAGAVCEAGEGRR